MYIHEMNERDVTPRFLGKSFLLRHERDMQYIRESGIRDLWIDVTRSLVIAPEPPAEPGESVPRSEGVPALGNNCQTVPMAEEIERAMQLCTQSKAIVARIFSDVRMGRIAELEAVDDLVTEVANSLLRHPDALLSMARLKSADEYTYLHSLAVCALMIGLARQLALPDKLVHEAGLAGLLLDIGKLGVPSVILGKPGNLSDDELAAIRRHPETGVHLLSRSGQFSEHVLDVCRHHHERYDGSGYPDKLAGSQISLFARMGAICDVYDAITSDRPHKARWSPAESIGKMAGWSGLFDEKIFHAFVKCVGIYPVGSLVRLQSGRLGIVIEQNQASLLKPKVRIFYSALRKVPIEHALIDLASADQDDRIISRECSRQWGFKNLDRIWLGEPLKQASGLC